ncbi:hypothetical protein [Mesorhizobium sp. BHbdii]
MKQPTSGPNEMKALLAMVSTLSMFFSGAALVVGGLFGCVVTNELFMTSHAETVFHWMVWAAPIFVASVIVNGITNRRSSE